MIYVDKVTTEDICNGNLLKLQSPLDYRSLEPPVYAGGSNEFMTCYSENHLCSPNPLPERLVYNPLNLNGFPERKLRHRLITITTDEFDRDSPCRK